MSNNSSQLFSFIISGAFEFQNRLQQPKDGLALTGFKKIEMEALSNHATVLLIEF